MIIKHCCGGLYFAIFNLLLIFNAQANSYINPAITTSHLGQGIDSATGQLKGRCIEGDEHHYKNQTVDLNLESAMTAQQSLDDFQGSIKGDVNLGLFAAGATVSVHIQIAESENTAVSGSYPITVSRWMRFKIDYGTLQLKVSKRASP